jgi:hypothetical protein
MRGALIHGALLVVMLVYGYRTWTRDKTIKPDLGSVVLWDKRDSDLVSIELKSDKKITKLERRNQGGETYWWGIETTIEKKPKPAEPPKPSEGSGSAGSATGSDAGSAAKPATPAEEEVRKVVEFPLGEPGDNLIKSYAEAHALRDLGQLSADQKKEYKLDDAKMTLTVTFKDGTRTFLVGGQVYGGSDRYVSDSQSKRTYVFSKDLISTLEVGESSLHLLEPRGFETTKLDAVTIEAAGKSKTGVRVKAGDPNGPVRSWGDPATKKPDQTLANFIDNTNNLRPTEYKPGIKVADLTLVLKLTFKDERGNQLGTLQLFKHEKPGELPPNTDIDPANPPKGETEYLILTEKTRVPAVVRRDTAQRTEQDIATVFSDHPTAIEPKGNPLGNTPLPPTNPHGAAPSPGGTPPAPGGSTGSAGAVVPTPLKPTETIQLKPATPGTAPPPPPAKSDATKPGPKPVKPTEVIQLKPGTPGTAPPPPPATPH